VDVVSAPVAEKECPTSKGHPVIRSVALNAELNWYGNNSERMIISVASGKGGTGKTLIATSLAFSLKNRGKVQLLDCDVEEPNDHIFLKPDLDNSEAACIAVPEIDTEKCNLCGKCAEVCAFNAIAILPQQPLLFTNLCHGCGACSYLCPQKAITETERRIGVVEWGQADGISFVHGKLDVGEAMAPPIIRKVKQHTSKDGIVIIDAPPGTSCPVVETVKDSHFCLLITEPTPFGLNDLMLAVEMVKELKTACGVVLNRAGSGDEKVLEYCRAENIPVLLTIPLDTGIARMYSRGITLAEGLPQWQNSFNELFNKITEMVDERNRCTER